jgi:hypothetical protein
MIRARCRKKCSLVEGLSSGDQPRAIAWQLKTSDPRPLEREVKKKTIDTPLYTLATHYNTVNNARTRHVSHVIIKRDTRSFEKHCKQNIREPFT